MIVTRPPSLSGKYDHFYSGDSAFNSEEEGFAEAYRLWRDSGDAAHLKPFILEDQTPMVFTMTPLSFDETSVVQDLIRRHKEAEPEETEAESSDDDDEEEDAGTPIPAEAIVMMCRISLRGIKGLLGPEGKPVPFERSLSKRYDVKMVTKKTLNWIGQIDRGALIAELGLRAFISTFAPQD